MKKVQNPQVFMVAATQVEFTELREAISTIGGEDAAKSWIGNLIPSRLTDSEILIEAAARMCYKSFAPGINPNVNKIRTDSKAYFENILKSGHGSVLEHATVTFMFVNVSRVFTHEIVRHRAGTAFSQESLRYVRLSEIPFWIPPTAEEESEVFEEAVEKAEAFYHELVERFGINDMKDFKRKKELTSLFRRIAPIGLATNITATANHRAWRHMIEKRCNEHAEEEIRSVFYKVAETLKNSFPMIYQDLTLNSDTQTATFQYPKV